MKRKIKDLFLIIVDSIFYTNFYEQDKQNKIKDWLKR